MKLTTVLPLIAMAALSGCHTEEKDPTTQALTRAAAQSISTATNATTACVTPGATCDTEIDALTDSAFTKMSTYLPDLDMTQLHDAIEDAVTYSVGTDGEYPELSFVYTDPSASQGASVLINGGVNGDSYAGSGSTPLINDEQGVYADEQAPLAAPDGEAGWYFKNSVAGQKVNYYIYSDDGSSSTPQTIADLRSIMATVKHYVAGADYFFNIYTLKENDGNDVAWYRSRVTLVSSDFGSVMADTTYTGEFNRDAAVTGDLTFDVGGSTVYSTGNASLTDIADERIFLIAFGTNSGAAADSVELTVKDVTLGFSSGSVKLVPVAAHATSDANFENTLAAETYMQITSGTDLFNGLVFKLNGGGSTFTATLVGGGDITLAQRVLLEKLDRGDGYNALVPEAVFDPTTGTLVFDFATALTLADLANLSAALYSDAGLMTNIGAINIAADGIDTSTP